MHLANRIVLGRCVGRRAHGEKDERAWDGVRCAGGGVRVQRSASAPDEAVHVPWGRAGPTEGTTLGCQVPAPSIPWLLAMGSVKLPPS